MVLVYDFIHRNRTIKSRGFYSKTFLTYKFNQLLQHQFNHETNVCIMPNVGSYPAKNMIVNTVVFARKSSILTGKIPFLRLMPHLATDLIQVRLKDLTMRSKTSWSYSNWMPPSGLTPESLVNIGKSVSIHLKCMWQADNLNPTLFHQVKLF